MKDKVEIVGFRSDKWYKKLIVIGYYIFIVMFAIGAIFINDELAYSTYDIVMSKIYNITILAMLLVPYLIMCNIMGLKNKLPLYKSSKKFNKALGIIITIIVFAIISGVIFDNMSLEYEERYIARQEAQLEEQRIKEAAEAEEKRQREEAEAEEQRQKEAVEAEEQKQKEIAEAEAKKQEENLEEQKENQRLGVTFEQIYTEYKKNELNADDMYRGNNYRITATIEGIGDGGLNGLFGDISVTATTYVDGKKIYLFCTFEEETQREKLKSVEIGTQITFDGYCNSWGSWSDCSVVE